MRAELPRQIAAYFIFGLGLIALVWVSAVGYPLSNFARLDGIASRIVRSDNLPIEILQSELAELNELESSKICFPKPMHNAAIIRGRLAQLAIDSSDPAEADRAVAEAIAMVKKSLSCAPADSFLWFALFWLQGSRQGYSEDLVGYLEKSYQFGTYEGWIALRRNKYALIIYPSLPKSLKDCVVKEFVALVSSGFIHEAGANLTGAGWPIRETLLAALSDVDIKYKRELGKDLRRSGIEIDIPGLAMPELRPWQVN